MSILKKLSDKSVWLSFYEYKMHQSNLRDDEYRKLLSFIENESYLPLVSRINAKQRFPSPKKVLINKAKAGKKRVVYTFPWEENLILSLITFLLRDYDHLFAPNLYSFRKHKTARTAINSILRIKNLDQKYTYRVDISSYFNSVNTSLFLPCLQDALCDDVELFDFLKGLLIDPFVLYDNEFIEEAKGIIPGSPVSSFFANLYLKDMDWFFHSKKIPYIRYSDDIIIFADSEEELTEYSSEIKKFINHKELMINPDKESISRPSEKWEFLGFSYHNGIIDISEVSLNKLKARMRRKARALMRWANQKNVPGEYAAKAFIKRFNSKLYDNPVRNELTWTRWYFPVINTSESLKAIDEYALECIRYLATGKRNKSKFNFRYDRIKELGYRSLVNEYYKSKRNN